MKILITGAAGFIGSNLSKKLIELGHFVTGVDNLSYGKIGNIETLLNHENFSFLQADVLNPYILKPIEADVVVHLASQKIPRYSSALRVIEENSMMLKNVLLKCKDDGSKLVFASTSDIYGKNPNIPYHENSGSVLGSSDVPRWSYALSKLMGEQQIHAYAHEFGLEFTIMRFFGSYGPGQNTTWWGGPQAAFIQNVIEGKTIELHGDGLQTRTFTYIEDTIQGIVKCMFHENSKNGIFNIASEPDEEVTIEELANTILDLMRDGFTLPEVVKIPYETFGKYEDVRRRVPSIEKIKSELGYKPNFKLREGLAKTIEWQTSL